MSELGRKIKELRELRGMSQTDLANAVGLSQPVINKLEKGEQASTKKLIEVAEALGVSPGTLDPRYAAIQGSSTLEQIFDNSRKPIHHRFFGKSDLPVFSAVEGGSGELVVSSDPIDVVPRPWYLAEVNNAYGVVITGESMFPAYEPGDMALVNPKLTYMRGRDHIFTTDPEDGHFKATIKRLVSVTESEWKVEQFNPPKVFTLDRTVWKYANRVVGKYNA
jgi:phage repressor protein C with HTH and peptisase S24 domain